jgi:acyl-CoA hydrolase
VERNIMIIDKTKKSKLTAVHSFTVFPQDLNYADTLFGGKVMAEMDIAGVKVVRRALYGSGSDGCVTASVDRIDFKKPAFLGDLITMVAEIKAIGKSSIHVRITVTRESIMGEIDDICAANFTFVAMKDKKPFQHGLSFELLEPNEHEETESDN